MGLSKHVITVLLLFFSVSSWSQVNRYMVFFKDKQGSVYAISNPDAFLTPKSIARRSKQQLVVNDRDIPVNQSYVDGVRNTGAEVLFRTRWMNGVLVQCQSSVITQIALLNYVSSVELVAPAARPPAVNGRKRSVKNTNDDGLPPATASQFAMIGLDKMHENGYRGEGILIAVFDSGFLGVDVNEQFTHLFAEGRLRENFSYDFVHKASDVYHYDDHGSHTFSILAAYQQDVFVGGAYKADFILFVTEDDPTEYKVEEYNWLFAAERADSLGVDIISASLGYNTFDLPSMDYKKSDLNGLTAVSTKAATWASERGMVVVVSAGNEGSNSWGTVTAPADANNVLAIGGVTSAGEWNPSSSKGPTADGRIKPDLAALGLGVKLIASSGSVTSGSGTSYATPLVASLAAGIWQQSPGFTNKQLMEMIKKTASHGDNPGNLLGYGIPNFMAVANLLQWVPQEAIFEVFPNPVVTEMLSIRPSSPEDIKSCVVEIVSAQGQVMVRETVSFSWLNRTYEADCSKLTSGVYFLHLITENQFINSKLIKL